MIQKTRDMNDFDRKLKAAAERSSLKIEEFDRMFMERNSEEFERGITNNLVERWNRELEEYLDRRYNETMGNETEKN